MKITQDQIDAGSDITKEGDHPGKHRAWSLDRIKDKYGATRLSEQHAQGSFALCG